MGAVVPPEVELMAKRKRARSGDGWLHTIGDIIYAFLEMIGAGK